MLKKLKVKLIRLNSKHRQNLLIDTEEQDRLQGENPSLYHVIKCRKRKLTRTIQQIRDDNGTAHTATMEQRTLPQWNSTHGHNGTAYTATMEQHTRPQWNSTHGHSGTAHTATMEQHTRPQWNSTHGHNGNYAGTHGALQHQISTLTHQ